MGFEDSMALLFPFIFIIMVEVLSLIFYLIIREGEKNMESLKRVLSSERLVLRPFEYSDDDLIYESWGKDAEVSRYVTWWEHTCLNDCKEYVSKVIQGYKDNDRMEWLVCLKDTDEPIGAICIFYSKKLRKWGFGNNYAKKYWHQGYASEALDTVLEYVFTNTNIEEIFGEHFEDNPNSGKVMMHCGMKYKSQSNITCKNKEYVSKYYEVTRFEWLLHKMEEMGTITSKRIILRGLKEDDIQKLVVMFSDKDVNKYLHKGTETSKDGIRKKLEQLMLRCIKKDYRYYVVADKKTDETIGVISLCMNDDGVGAHSSYCYRKEFWNKGYATEALKAIMCYAFDMYDICYFECSCAHPNEGSAEVMKKSGLKCMGYYKFGEMLTVDCMSGTYPRVRYNITRHEWTSGNKSRMIKKEERLIK